MLLNSSQKLQIVLAGAVTTNQLPVVSSYAEHKDDSSTLTIAAATTATNNTTAVDVIAAPAANYLRQVKSFNVFNADTVPATVTVRIDDGGTTRVLIKVALWANWRLEFEPGFGWRVFDSFGVPVAEQRPQKLADIQYVANSAGSLFSNPAGQRTVIRSITLHNTNTTTETVVLHNVPDSSGSLGTAGTSTRIFSIALIAGDSVLLPFGDEGLVLTDTNDSLQAVTTTASKVTATLHGLIG